MFPSPPRWLLRLRRSSGAGEELPERAARGGGASTELPPLLLAAPPPRVTAVDEDEVAFRLVREGDPAPTGMRRFSDGLMVLRDIDGVDVDLDMDGGRALEGLLLLLLLCMSVGLGPRHPG